MNKQNVFSRLRIRLSIENTNRPLQASNDSFIFKASDSLIEKYRAINAQEKRRNDLKNNSFFGL